MEMLRKLYIIAATVSLILATIFSSYAQAAEIPKVLLPVKNSPLVTYRIQFRVGSIDDPEGKKGLTALTARLLVEGGTQKRTYEEIIDFLYPMATRIVAQVDKEVTTITGTIHIDNLENFHPLLMEMILEPGFRVDDFERIRTNLVNYLEKQLRGNDDENLGKEALNVSLYEDHPYGTPVQGLVSDLKSISLEDAKAHYEAYFTRENVTLGIAGGYENDLVRRSLRDLSELAKGRVPYRQLPEPTSISDIEVLCIDKECQSTAISIGCPINVTRADKDFYPLLIANSYFGEHRTFNGVLMVRMRQVRGLNYGDYSYIENFIQERGSTFPLVNIPRRQQCFSIWIRPVLHKSRHFSLRLALWELERLVQEGISREDFETTKKFLINYCRLWAQNQSRRLGYLMDSRCYQTDDFLKTLPDRLRAVTHEDVNAAIKRYLNPKDLKVTIVTKDAAEFLQDLISNKPSPIIYEAEDMPQDVLEEDKQIEVFELRINKEKSRVVRANDLFE